MGGGNFTVNGWLIEPQLGRLTKRNKTVHLEPQVMKVLALLAAHAGEVVSKDQLIDDLWHGGVVSDAALARCISQIRVAFGDSAKKSEYIATVPKIGYRLIARVGEHKQQRQGRASVWRWSVAAAMTVALVTLGQVHGFVGIKSAPATISTAESLTTDGRRLYNEYTYPFNENAIALFERALEFDPQYGLAYAGLADALLRQAHHWGGERQTEALGLAGRAVELAPQYAESHRALGKALALTGNTEDALLAYQHALDIDPQDWASALASADLYVQELDFDKAETMYLEALSQTPNNDTAMSSLGYLYLKSGDVDAARSWFDQALQRFPLQQQAAARLAMLELFTGQPGQALSRCARLVESYPRHYACLQLVAVANLVQGDIEEASRGFEKVLELYPEDRYARLGRAKILLAQSQQTEAFRLIDQVLSETREKIAQDDPESYDYWLIAGCHTLQGDEASAYYWFDKAAAEGRRFPLWDANDPLFATLHGDSRFDRYIAATHVVLR